jgi:hypothetical protein
MNRLILTAIAAISLAGFVAAQDVKVQLPAATDPATIQQEFNQVMNEWLNFNNWDKEAAYKVLNDLNGKIRSEFPLDPQIQKALEELNRKQYAELDAKAKEMGYTNFKDALASSDPRAADIKLIMTNYDSQRFNLTAAYNEEFNRRYHSACIDAMKRLMENAAAMK